MAIWPSTMKILRDELVITELDLGTSKSMVINRKGSNKRLEIKPPEEITDKGFMKRSHLLARVLNKVKEIHPDCIRTDHKCLRVRFEKSFVTAEYETNGSIVKHACDLLVSSQYANSLSISSRLDFAS